MLKKSLNKKTKTKNYLNLEIRFYLILLLVLFVGLFSIGAMWIFYKHSAFKGHISDIIEELDYLTIKSFQLAQTNNLTSYALVKEELENKKALYDSINQKIHPTFRKFKEHDKFEKGINEFSAISNALIRLQKKNLILNKELSEKITLENQLRHKLRNLLLQSDNHEIIALFNLTEDYSRELLNHYENQESLNSWFNSIKQVKAQLAETNLAEEINKAKLLENLNSYQFLALDLGQLIVEEQKIKTEKALKIAQLQKAIQALEIDRGVISREINLQNKRLAKNSFILIMIITGTGIIFLIRSRLYFRRLVK